LKSNESESTQSKKNTKVDTTTHSDPKPAGVQKEETIRLGDELVQQLVSRGAVRLNIVGDKKDLPKIVGALDYLMRVGIKDSSSVRPENLRSRIQICLEILH